jgi:translation initiation factor 2 alpha subunit (eIF-2alpha)
MQEVQRRMVYQMRAFLDKLLEEIKKHEPCKITINYRHGFIEVQMNRKIKFQRQATLQLANQSLHTWIHVVTDDEGNDTEECIEKREYLLADPKTDVAEIIKKLVDDIKC